MLLSSMPVKFGIAFASSAGVGFIQNPLPVASLGPTSGRASFADGFPPLTFEQIASGGNPPWGADMNGVLFMETSWTRWINAGGPALYDSAFSGTVGGYPKGALLQKAATNDRYWLSTVDNNVTNPDSAGAGWVAFPDLIVQQQAANYTATDTGTQNHPNITLPIGTTVANLIGAPIRFRIAFANTITNPDIIINGSAAIPMFNSDGSAIVANQFAAVGTLVEGKLVATNDFRVTSPGKPVTSPPPATPFIPGMIFLWGAETPPVGALECDGSLQLISAYPNLYAVIGTRFGGNGTTNFALPDCRGAFVRGWDHGRGLDPNAGNRTGSPFPSTVTVVGDHVGSWEKGALQASLLTGASIIIQGQPYANVVGGTSLHPIIQYPNGNDPANTGPNADTANWGPDGFFLPNGTLAAPLGTLTQGTQTGLATGTQQSGVNQTFSPNCYALAGVAKFTGGAGTEVRPVNFNLMYCIAY